MDMHSFLLSQNRVLNQTLSGQTLQFRISEAVHQSVNLHQTLAEFALCALISAVIRNIFLLENGVHLHTCHLADRTEDG